MYGLCPLVLAHLVKVKLTAIEQIRKYKHYLISTFTF